MLVLVQQWSRCKEHQQPELVSSSIEPAFTLDVDGDSNVTGTDNPGGTSIVTLQWLDCRRCNYGYLAIALG